MGGPPEHITPARLFRIFLRAPRATLPVELPPLFGPSCGAFFVQALTPQEEDDAWEAAQRAPEVLRNDAYHAELVARALVDTKRRQIFACADELCEFDEHDYNAIVRPALLQYACIAPTYRRSDSEAWVQKLALGAVDPQNFHHAAALAWCIDWSDRARVPRPDRYFGVPAGQLTDGQWMVWRAAKQAIIDSRNHE